MPWRLARSLGLRPSSAIASTRYRPRPIGTPPRQLGCPLSPETCVRYQVISHTSSGTDLKRQFHPHGRSFAVTGALELQRSTVSFGDKTRDIKTDPHPCERRGAPGPTDERLPEIGQIGSGDADPLVRDPDLGGAVAPVQCDTDLAPGR